MNSPSPEAISLVLPLWQLGGGLVACLGVAWQGFRWLRGQMKEVSDASNEKALSSKEHKEFIRGIFAQGFTDHAELEHRRMQAVTEQIGTVKTRLEAHEQTERVWHEETRRSVDKGTRDSATTIMRATGEWIRERDSQLRDLGEIRDDHERRIKALEMKVSTWPTDSSP